MLLGAGACAAGLLLPLGASAQSNGTENYYTPPKIKKQGTSQTPLAGNGKVLVKVLVNPDGTFKVQGVITSTNHGDDAAALEIARSSSYVPAVRGPKKVVAFYDFTLKFTGGSTVSGGQAEGSELGRYEMELHAANYTGAQAGLKAYVEAHPGDPKAELDLAVADTFLNDDAAAAAAFDKVGTIPANYKAVAAKAYIQNAVNLLNNKDTVNGLAAAKRAAEIAPGFASYDTRGVAELLSSDFPSRMPASSLSTAPPETPVTTPARSALRGGSRAMLRSPFYTLTRKRSTILPPSEAVRFSLRTASRRNGRFPPPTSAITCG